MRLFILALSISLSLSILPSISSSSSSLIQFSIDGKVLELDESNFEATISSFDYVFVDFYTPWCGHCADCTVLVPTLNNQSNIGVVHLVA
ncbi:Protein disulfide-isomerase 5-2 [Camellia lanceoleosa]|uniref:Protein disulfide-isomerase 5-2 n=1 Tax=Camellia lanceoleosa TaxID=1840588 RepID=A0ACC0IIE8_9ERIC|nr:Protein disulfide-isomerase 5-2 [Camellia lanceoleosa]